MKKEFRKLMRDQVQDVTDGLTNFAKNIPFKKGWIRTIRDSLGISSKALSTMLHCSQSNIVALEQSEINGKISLNSLEKIARALNCKLVYGFVPLKPLEQILKDRAQLVARRQLKTINHTMALEEQALHAKQASRQEAALIDELLRGPSKKLWN